MLEDEVLSIINELNHKLNQLNNTQQSHVEGSSTNKSNLNFIDCSVVKILKMTINELSSKQNSTMMPLVHETINNMIGNFTQSYPDIPKKQKSDSCSDEVIKPQTSVDKPTINNNSVERCFNLIENPIIISSDDSETVVMNYQFEYNPRFIDITNQSELTTKPTNIKRKLKTCTQDFHLVLNIGFGYSPKGIILKCFAGYCNLKSYDRHFFQTHYEKCHAIIKFNGTCESCEQTLNINNVSEELDHIYKFHMTEATKQKKDDLPSDENEEISEVQTVSDATTKSMMNEQQIDELIKQLENTDDTDDLPISSEMDIAVLDNSLMHQTIDISSTKPLTTQKLPETPMELLSSDNEVSVDLFENITNHETKNHTKSSFEKLSKKSSKRLGKTIDPKLVVKKKYKNDKDPSEKPTATATPNLYLRVSLTKLSDETITHYLNRKEFEDPKTTTKNKSKHKEPSKRKQDKSIGNKDVKIQITKQIIPTVFKRSLSLNSSRSEISPIRSPHKIDPLKITLKKCDINKNKTGSNSYKILNGSMEPHSSDENPEKMINTESIVPSKNPGQKQEMTKYITPKTTVNSPDKLFDETIMLLNEAEIHIPKLKMRPNLCSIDKAQSRENKTQSRENKTPNRENKSPNTVESNIKNDTHKTKNDAHNMGRSSSTEVPSTSKRTDENNIDESSSISVTKEVEQSINKSIANTNVEKLALKSPFKNNDRQLAIDKAVILAQLSACTLHDEIKSPHESINSLEIDSEIETDNSVIIVSTPTSDHVPTVKHIHFRLLQPWLKKRSHSKYDISCRTQLQKIGLLARYKCMGCTCSFYTSEKSLFTSHLKLHKYHAIDNSDTFLFCSNCKYTTTNIEKLINHVQFVHQHDRYQCPYCFYRSCEVQSCATHVTKHHPFNKKCIMECPIDDVPIDVDQLNDKLQKNRLNYVAPFRCTGKFNYNFVNSSITLILIFFLCFIVCNKCFFLGGAFIKHIKTHEDKSEQPIVQKAILLLQKCMDENHYGLNQCLYCVHGTKTEGN